VLKGERKTMLDYYEETLKELEEIELNLDDLSRNEIHHVLRSIVNRGWLQIETMFGQYKKKEYSKEEIQEHFNAMLNVIPMTSVKRKNDKT
tara:strand:+ start:651 stop:923 length:273 start_codon:yes stop_codon:yes gene_type:complete